MVRQQDQEVEQRDREHPQLVCARIKPVGEDREHYRNDDRNRRKMSVDASPFVPDTDDDAAPIEDYDVYCAE
jgi:hypothetical protein